MPGYLPEISQEEAAESGVYQIDCSVYREERCINVLPAGETMIRPTPETYLNVPETMRSEKLRRWVCFQCIPQINKSVKKTPLMPTGKYASITDSRTWSSFRECSKAIEYCVGNALGFAISSDYKLAVIDLDHCIRPDNTLTETALKYILKLKTDSYIEKSISGTGIHIFFWYTGDKLPVHPEPCVEIYTDDRFVVLTGVMV